MPYFIIDQITLIEHSLLVGLSAVAAGFCLLYLNEYKKNQKLKKNVTSLKRTEIKSLSILHRAFKKAQSILGRAELEGVKMVADSRYLTKKFEEEYEAQLQKHALAMEKTLSEEIKKAEEEYKEHLSKLQIRAEQIQVLNEELIRQRTDDVFKRFEERLATLLSATEQKSMTAISGEIRSARELIDKYKAEQLGLIDENIMAMLEKTLSMVLSQKISLEDETDLVYEALEKAKGEKFII